MSATVPNRLVNEHMGVIVALAPILIVGAKIVITARGNSVALAQIVRDADASQVLLATVASALLPVLQFSLAYVGSGRNGRIWAGLPVSSDLNFAVLMLVLFTILVGSMQPWLDAVIALGFVSLVVLGDPFARLMHRRRIRKASEGRSSSGRQEQSDSVGGAHRVESDSELPAGLAFLQGPVLAAGLIAMLLLSQASWLPTEDIALKGQRQRTAYILKTDGDSLSLLWLNGQTAHISLDSIDQRIPCRRNQPSFFSLVNGDDVDKAPPKCAD